VIAPTPGTPATTPPWWTRSDEWQEALRNALHSLGIHAEDHGHSEHFVLDTLLNALVAPVAAREAAAYARGHSERDEDCEDGIPPCGDEFGWVIRPDVEATPGALPYLELLS
jgi:hypothetical protein